MVLALATIFLVLGTVQTTWALVVDRVLFVSLGLPIATLLFLEALLITIDYQDAKTQIELWRQVQFLVTQLSLDVFGLGSLTIIIGSALYFFLADPKDGGQSLSDWVLPTFLISSLVALALATIRLYPWF